MATTECGDYLDEELRNVDGIPAHAGRTLDPSRPVALVLLGVVIFFGDDENPTASSGASWTPSRPAAAWCSPTPSPSPSPAPACRAVPDVDAAVAFRNEQGTPQLTRRAPADVTRFFDGSDLLAPGVVSCNHWRPDPAEEPPRDEVAMYGGVGRKA
ncbi:SAM-dependent methyltransferase [Streptomyces sp. NPDC059011]|uniref:SAM-dependent methyltransferase n=1 Tax=unclassified Streptomyces TaxID=2593676 RepID=UPI00368BBD61